MTYHSLPTFKIPNKPPGIQYLENLVKFTTGLHTQSNENDTTLNLHTVNYNLRQTASTVIGVINGQEVPLLLDSGTHQIRSR